MQQAGVGGRATSWGKLLAKFSCFAAPAFRPCVPGQLGKSGHQEARLGPN